MDRATSLVKALDLLSILGGSERGHTVQDLALAMDKPRSTVIRILNTLVEYGLVERRGRLYAPGSAFAQWARPDRYQAFRQRYRKVLEHVAGQTGELVLLGLQEGAGIVHIDYIESDQAVRVAPAPATRHNIRHNAIGKLCIAARGDLAEYWTRGKPAFARELVQVRRAGFAWNRGESIPGMVALAGYGFSRAPTEPKLAVAWPAHRFTEQKGREAMRALNEALGR